MLEVAVGGIQKSNAIGSWAFIFCGLRTPSEHLIGFLGDELGLNQSLDRDRDVQPDLL